MHMLLLASLAPLFLMVLVRDGFLSRLQLPGTPKKGKICGAH